MTTPSRDVLLLTGAGFTRNFGGFLAREMWSKIFNNPTLQENPEVRGLFLQDFDFESVYANVLTGTRYNDVAKESLRKAVEDAYKDLDEAVKGWVFNSDNPTALNTYGWGELVSMFSQRGSEKGWFFTLNQDLFMERHFGNRSPGASFGQPFVDRDEGGGVKLITLPDVNALDKAKTTLNNTSYIKLHGSYGWVSSRGGTQMVIGRNKADDINREPLLKWYLDLFQENIYEGGKKLFIIGYGFSDTHINDILLKGVQEHQLILYIINTMDPEDFKNKLEGRPPVPASYEISKYIKIWEGVRGYFPYSLREIFPPDQSKTTVANEFKRILAS